jgi:hypothetical protein
MSPPVLPNLKPRKTRDCRVTELGENGWRLEIPAGPAGTYRLAQLDDYNGRKRRDFPWEPPLEVSLRARASGNALPGTWGFGLWNDPFGVAFIRGVEARLPVLPNAAWFFFASPPNYLSLREDLPARGNLAAVFRSPGWPGWLLGLGAPALPLLLWTPARRLMRRFAQRIVRQRAVDMEIDPVEWHAYSLTWRSTAVTFRLDGEVVMESDLAPGGPLGLVIWVDNQYAALPPEGRLVYGSLANPEPAWIEIEALELAVQL